MPNLFQDLLWIWDAFCTLNKCRTSGMAGPDPLEFIQIQAMANELEINGDTRTRFFDRVILLDTVFLEHCQKQAESQQTKSKQRKR